MNGNPIVPLPLSLYLSVLLQPLLGQALAGLSLVYYCTIERGVNLLHIGKIHSLAHIILTREQCWWVNSRIYLETFKKYIK